MLIGPLKEGGGTIVALWWAIKWPGGLLSLAGAVVVLFFWPIMEVEDSFPRAFTIYDVSCCVTCSS